MTVVLFLLLLFLQQGNSEETLLLRNNKTSNVNITTSEETCEKVAEMCTYNLPRMDEIPDYEQCQVIFRISHRFNTDIHLCQGQEGAGEPRLLYGKQHSRYPSWICHQPLQPGCLHICLLCVSSTSALVHQKHCSVFGVQE